MASIEKVEDRPTDIEGMDHGGHTKDVSTGSREGSVVSDTEDLLTWHERNAGRLVVDPEEARIEFGEKTAARLKLSRDGTKVLWPQPTDNPEDPLNWSDRKKSIMLAIITLSAIVPDFDSAIGIASLFPLAAQYNTSTAHINNLTSNWSIFLLGPAGVFTVMVIRRWGRLPVLFWSQLIALGFLLGCTVAPNLTTFAVMRCLAAFWGNTPQVAGLYIVTDMYPFHMQARKLNIWTMGFIIGPYISPFVFGFLVARTTWRWAYGIGCIYGAIVVVLIFFFMEETLYDRSVKPIPKRPSEGLRYRAETLVGITAFKMSKYRPSWWTAISSPFRIVWRPHLALMLLFEGIIFGFGIGLNVTNVVFLGTPSPVGYGLTQFAIAGAYGAPIVGVILGELIGRYANDFIANTLIRKNKGVFEPEMRLWACYIAMPLYVVGFVLIGAAIQNHLNLSALIIGWCIAVVAIMINTVAVYAYLNNAFPRHQGEISALVNFARTLGGFAVPYFQLPWATKNGAIQTFGCEAAIAIGLFLLIVPFIQWKGASLRVRFSAH